MKKIIVRIAEGLGNQLFMYSHAYSLSKKLGYELQIDNTSGYFKTKNRFRNYDLDKFNISTPTCDDNDKFDTYSKDFKRKILKMIDLIKTNKCFYLEKKNNDKSTAYYDFSNYQFSNKLFTEGYFQTEKYFIDYSKDLKKELLIKNVYLDNNNKYIDLLKKDNSVSICIRQNRYSRVKLKIIKSRVNLLYLQSIILKDLFQFLKKRLINLFFLFGQMILKFKRLL